MAGNKEPGPDEFCKRWTDYATAMRANMSELISKSDKSSVENIRPYLLLQMPLEIGFIDLDYFSKRRERDICSDFWNCMVFRPDMAHFVATQLHGPVGLLGAAALLDAAIAAAGWPQEFWLSDVPEPRVSSLAWKRGLSRAADALAGFATTALTDLQCAGLLDAVAVQAIDAKAAFHESRGRELVRFLSRAKPQQLWKACEKNRFLLRVFEAAVSGHWAGPPAAFALSELPKFFSQRHFLKEAKEKMAEATASERQHWIVLHGLAGAGKTTAALYLAHQLYDFKVLWIPFGQRSEEVIHQAALSTIRCCLPGVDPSEFASAKDCLSHILTLETTNDLVFFFDDVWEPAHLSPFADVKVAVVTSRCRLQYYRVTETTLISVPLSLEEKESVALLENVLGDSLRSLSGGELVLEMLRTVYFNALATSVIAAHIAHSQRSKWNAAFFSSLKVALTKNAKQRFQTMSQRLRARGHDYLESGHEHVNIFATLDFIVESLEGEVKEAFLSLVVFPRGTMLSAEVFQRINDDEEYLEILCEHSLLQAFGSQFSIHDLLRDIIEAELQKDLQKRKAFFERLVESYDDDDLSEASTKEDFYFLHLVPTCLEADRVDAARRLLTSANYLISRFYRCRFTNFSKDFGAVLGREKDDSLEMTSFHNFLRDPSLWFQDFDRTSLLRQTLVLDRGVHLNDPLLALAKSKEEVTLPLFRAESQVLELRVVYYEEVAHSRLYSEIEDMAINDEGFVLAVTESGDLLLLAPGLQLVRKSSIAEAVLRAAPNGTRGWLLVTGSGCLLLDSQLCEVARWSAGTTVEGAAVAAGGDLAALWSPDKPVMLFRTEDWAMEREMAACPEGWEFVDSSLAVCARYLAGICRQWEPKDPENGTGKWHHQLLVWSIEGALVKNVQMEGEFNFSCSCAFLLNDVLAVAEDRKLRLVDWRTGSSKTKDFSFDVKTVRASPDGSSAGAVGVFYSSLRVVDKDLYQMFSAEDFAVLSPCAFALSNSVLVLATGNYDLQAFQRCGQTVVVLPTIRPFHNVLSVKWLHELEDFALFHLEDERLVILPSSPADDHDVFSCSLKGWLAAKVVDFEGGVLIWEPDGRRLLLVYLHVEEKRSECFTVDEDTCISTVACRGSRLVVGSSNGAVLLRNGSEWRSLAHRSGGVLQLAVMEEAIAVLFTGKRFRMFSLDGRELFAREEVINLFPSPRGHRVALQFFNVSDCRNIILEVSCEGQEVRKIEHSAVAWGAHYFSDSLLSWTGTGEAFITAEGTKRYEFPTGVEQVEVVEGGSLAVLRTCHHRLFITDFKSSELVFDKKSLRSKDVWAFHVSPHARRILVVSEDLQCFVLEQLS